MDEHYFPVLEWEKRSEYKADYMIISVDDEYCIDVMLVF